MEGREFGGREAREDVIDRVKVRDAEEGLGKDCGNRDGEEEKNLTDILEVDLIGLSGLISH